MRRGLQPDCCDRNFRLPKRKKLSLSNQISPSTKIVGFYQHLGQTADGAATQFAAYESRQVTYVPVHTGKVEWQMARGNQFMSFQYGFWNEVQIECIAGTQSRNT